jgi:hypothetical protein
VETPGTQEAIAQSLQEDVNYLNNNNNNNYHPQHNQGWNQQQRPNYSGNYSSN